LSVKGRTLLAVDGDGSHQLIVLEHGHKNPLNFVNNFSAISVELIDELREALAGANLDNRLRAQISEIADMLQGNLDKVVQHGKN
jgi:two-component system, NtrC family, sensor kinase